MAEKEERILITKCSSGCLALRISCDPFDDKDGMYCDKSGKCVRVTEKECSKCKDPVLLGMSRQEAIEKMALAMFERERPGSRGEVPIEDVWQDLKEGYLASAEAALNALLGEK
jgi:hypothetical protein